MDARWLGAYSLSEEVALNWRSQKLGVYEDDGSINSYAKQLGEYFRLALPPFNGTTSAIRDTRPGGKGVTKIVLKQEAPSKAWPISKDIPLRLLVCTKLCGVAGCCYSCGSMARLFADILEDERYDVMGFS